MSHPDDHLLHRYAFGHLDDARMLSRIAVHLEECEQCRVEVEQARRIGEAIEEHARAAQCGPARRVRASVTQRSLKPR